MFWGHLGEFLSVGDPLVLFKNHVFHPGIAKSVRCTNHTKMVPRLKSTKPGCPSKSGRIASCPDTLLGHTFNQNFGPWKSSKRRICLVTKCNSLPISPSVMAPWGQLLPSQFSMIVSHGILAATVKGSVKLGLICFVVGMLLKAKKLPQETSRILSQVVFNLCIPSLLFTRVASSLATAQDALLLWVPLAAITQIGLGWLVGLGAALLLEKGAFFLPLDPNQRIPMPTKAAPVIAATTALAIGNPMAAHALVPKSSSPPIGLVQMVMCSCMFGNSLTLPLIFMLTLVPTSMAASATAFIAMFLIGWSPVFWTLGMEILASTKRSRDEGEMQEITRFGTPLVPEIPRSIPVGLYQPSSSSSSSPSTSNLMSGDPIVITPTFFERFSSFFVLILHRATALSERVLNPPLISIAIGCLVGLTPVGRVLFCTDGAQDLATWTTTKIGAGIIHGVLGCINTVIEVLVFFGDATLPLGAIVLASSLFAKIDDEKEQIDGTDDQPWWRILIPKDVFERRAMMVVSMARFLIMPLVGLASIVVLSKLGTLPKSPVCHMAILIQSVMPPAQNLVLMMNLHEETRPLVPATAGFLMRMYVLSILPITFWVTVFVLFTGVELA